MYWSLLFFLFPNITEECCSNISQGQSLARKSKEASPLLYIIESVFISVGFCLSHMLFQNGGRSRREQAVETRWKLAHVLCDCPRFLLLISNLFYITTAFRDVFHCSLGKLTSSPSTVNFLMLAHCFQEVSKTVLPPSRL